MSVETNMTSRAKPVRFSRRFVGVAEDFGAENLSSLGSSCWLSRCWLSGSCSASATNPLKHCKCRRVKTSHANNYILIYKMLFPITTNRIRLVSSPQGIEVLGSQHIGWPHDPASSRIPAPGLHWPEMRGLVSIAKLACALRHQLVFIGKKLWARCFETPLLLASGMAVYEGQLYNNVSKHMPV